MLIFLTKINWIYSRGVLIVLLCCLVQTGRLIELVNVFKDILEIKHFKCSIFHPTIYDVGKYPPKQSFTKSGEKFPFTFITVLASTE